MDIVYVILSPFVETATVIAFLAVIGVLAWLLTEKTSTGRRIMTWIEMAGLSDEQKEMMQSDFRIHPANYRRG